MFVCAFDGRPMLSIAVFLACKRIIDADGRYNWTYIGQPWNVIFVYRPRIKSREKKITCHILFETERFHILHSTVDYFERECWNKHKYRFPAYCSILICLLSRDSILLLKLHEGTDANAYSCLLRSHFNRSFLYLCFLYPEDWIFPISRHVSLI